MNGQQLLTDEMDEIRADYATSLLELTFNSKPIINMLTTIAQENLHAAAPIVRAIEDRIASAPPQQKLPSIYLLDSICKNVGSPFTTLFSRNLYKTFMDCYTAVDNTTRGKLSDLFKTWKLPVTGSHSLMPVFPVEDTRKIEETLMRMRIIQERSAYASPSPFGAPWQHGQADFSRFASPAMGRPPIVDHLLQDVDGLLHTLETRVRINAEDYQSMDLMQKLRQLHEILYTTALRPAQLEEIRAQLRGIASLCAQPVLPIHTPTPVPPAFGQMPEATSMPVDLFAQLTKAGIIGGAAPLPSMPMKPIIELNSQAMLVSHPELIKILYEDMPLQCYQCGQRWQDSPTERALKDEHLDWHFKTNKRLREHAVRSQSRALYLTETDWISFTSENSHSKETVPAGKSSTTSVMVETTVTKPSDPTLQDATCPICKESFITSWDDAAEEWIWKNAVNVNGTIYHSNCYADASAAKERADAREARNGTIASKGGTDIKVKEERDLDQGDEDEDEDEDIVLPMHVPEVKPEDVVKEEPAEPSFETDAEQAGVQAPFVLTEALKSLSGTLSALNGSKRKASEELEDTVERRVKEEPTA